MLVQSRVQPQRSLGFHLELDIRKCAGLSRTGQPCKVPINTIILDNDDYHTLQTIGYSTQAIQTTGPPSQGRVRTPKAPDPARDAQCCTNTHPI